MKETAVNKIPYPESTDEPNGPAQIKALAELLDTLKWGSRNLKPTIGMVEATENLTLSGVFQDIPGLVVEITPDVESKLLVVPFIQVAIELAGQQIQHGVMFDGVDQTAQGLYGGGATSDDQIALFPYLLTLAAGEKHTIKARSAQTAGETGSRPKITKNYSRMLYLMFAA